MRLFYSCPIKAEFMHKYYGMQFQRQTDEGMQDVIPFFYRQTPKFYINKESLDLLTPQTGDVVLNGIVPFRISDGGGAHTLDTQTAKEIAEAGNLRIIERNNRSFIWPELDLS